MLTADIGPTVEGVGALLRARTRDENGNELGTFTDQTRPTAAEVAGMLEQGAAEVRAALPADVRDDLAPQIESLMALATALRIELAYFPDQVAAGRSPFEQYRQLYQDGLRALSANVADNQPGGPTRVHSIPLRTLVDQVADLPAVN